MNTMSSEARIVLDELTRLRGALETARHELMTLNGLHAADAAEPQTTWIIDTNGTLCVIDAALNATSCTDTQPS
ncbi:MAG: hypothetical protein M5R41_10430 [Bacteroidia bacterium]|nr:hypothetical protein [Bacteroidia bacterium]